MKSYFRLYFVFIVIGCLCYVDVWSQDTINSTAEEGVYRPYSMRMRDGDSLDVVIEADSLNSEIVADSILFSQHYLDSIAAREQFIQDSILAREQFVRDSLLRRQQIADSVHFLAETLPAVLKASVSLLNEDIILAMHDIDVIGDSILTDFTYTTLPNRFVEPYTPWKNTVNLSDKPIQIEVDTTAHVIKKITAPDFGDIYSYKTGVNVIRITRQGMFTKKQSGTLYKSPIDSVFFNRTGKVVKVKRYIALYQATDNYQLGALVLNHLWQVKQFTYSGNELASFEVVKFCDRWKLTDPNKVCNISTYNITKQGSYAYGVERKNNPENLFSDGTYKYEFDNLYNLKSVTFRNVKNTENWRTFIELNEEGNVSRYVYQKNGIVNRTLLVNYYHNTPGAKHLVETVTCTFEDDGISYFQRNNTTEKSRTRDRLTGEWGDWQ